MLKKLWSLYTYANDKPPQTKMPTTIWLNLKIVKSWPLSCAFTWLYIHWRPFHFNISVIEILIFPFHFQYHPDISDYPDILRLKLLQNCLKPFRMRRWYCWFVYLSGEEERSAGSLAFHMDFLIYESFWTYFSLLYWSYSASVFMLHRCSAFYHTVWGAQALLNFFVTGWQDFSECRTKHSAEANADFLNEA